MKKILIALTTVFMLFSGSLLPVLAIEENEQSEVYTSYKELSEEEMTEIFLKGYKKIICYDQSRSSGTHSVTTCTEMKKRNYDYVGYSKSCFYKTYTSVNLTSSSSSISIALGGISVSVDVSNATSVDGSGAFELTDAEKTKVKSGDYFSCLRARGYLTKATYSSKIYDNATGQLINTTTYTHTYTFGKNTDDTELNYYLVIRTSDQCEEIKDNSYLGTDSEKTAMNKTKWITVSNPSTASIVPDSEEFE